MAKKVKALVSFKSEDLNGNKRFWHIVKRGTKFTIVITQNGVNSMIKGVGWFATKLEACQKLQEFADAIEGNKQPLA